MTGEIHKHGYGPVPTGILIAVLTIAVVAMAAFSLTGNSDHGPPAEAGDSGSEVDPNPAGVDPSTPAESATQAEPIATGIEISEKESGLKLLRKEGPFTFPPYGKRDRMGYLITQEVKIDMLADEGVRFSVIAGSNREINVLDQRGYADIIVLLVLKDKEGNPVMCGWDSETQNYFFSKTVLEPTLGIAKETTYGVSPVERGTNARMELGNQIYSWEVLVYG